MLTPMNAFAPRPMQSQMMPMGQNSQMQAQTAAPQQGAPGQQMMQGSDLRMMQPGMQPGMGMSNMRMAQPGMMPQQPMPVNMPQNAFAPRQMFAQQ